MKCCYCSEEACIIKTTPTAKIGLCVEHQFATIENIRHHQKRILERKLIKALIWGTT